MRLLTSEILRRCDVGTGDTVLAAFSGGADSTALLIELSRMKDEGAIAGVFAAHFNHGIRGAEADADESFCIGLCVRIGVELFRAGADVPQHAKDSGMTLEQAARDARYRFLKAVKAETGAAAIAVAHHMDDQAETVLLHLLRGSALRGLGGMQMHSGDIIRPLLGVRRAEIEAFLAQAGQPYCTDSSNFEEDAMRNRIRRRLLPELASYNPAVVQTLCRMADSLRTDEALLADMADKALETAKTPSGWVRNPLADAPASVGMRAARAMLETVDYDLTQADIRRVHALLSAQTGTEIELSGGVAAWVDAEELCIGRPQKLRVCHVPFVRGGRSAFLGGWIDAETAACRLPQASAFEAYLDADAVPADAVIRTRLPGDRFYPLGAPGRRKLSDYLIDRKLPRRQRDIPMLCSGADVLFLPGCTIAETVKVTEQTRHILHLFYKEDWGK